MLQTLLLAATLALQDPQPAPKTVEAVSRSWNPSS